MLYCENWDKIKERYLEFWAMENHDRPLMKITAPKDRQDIPPVSIHTTEKERWMDTEYVIKHANWKMQNTLYLGEAYPSLNPNLGPDYFAACYGTEITFGKTTSWAEPWMTDDDVENYNGFKWDRENVYYKKMLELTSAAVEDGKDKYLVGVTDLHPGPDAIVSMRGPQNLCYDTFDYPDFIKKASMDFLPDYKEMYDELYQMTQKYQKGSTCWMGVWHPKRWYPLSCDFSCMISQEMYEDMVVEELELEAQWLDASLYHLDGPDAFKHLDRILKIPRLGGVQFAYGAGAPTASHWIDYIKKIQAAGKCVHIIVEPSELEIMLKELSPEGLIYQISANSEQEARDLLKMAEAYKKKI